MSRLASPPMTDVVTVERVIPAPPQPSSALLTDPARHQDIDGSGTVREPKAATERLVLGSEFGMSMKLGVPYSMVSKVIELRARTAASPGRPGAPAASARWPAGGSGATSSSRWRAGPWSASPGTSGKRSSALRPAGPPLRQEDRGQHDRHPRAHRGPAHGLTRQPPSGSGTRTSSSRGMPIDRDRPRPSSRSSQRSTTTGPSATTTVGTASSASMWSLSGTGAPSPGGDLEVLEPLDGDLLAVEVRHHAEGHGLLVVGVEDDEALVALLGDPAAREEPGGRGQRRPEGGADARGWGSDPTA